MSELEPVIGLEVHAQLQTRSKIFCACAVRFGEPPNSLTCPVCLGLPGALPVLNRHVVTLALRMALAVGCTIRRRSIFARKNYFYPDLPKGYQISQYDEPLAEHGRVRIEIEGTPREIAIRRIHLEEDAGKLIHEGPLSVEGASLVDFNRSGTPLIEIVGEPDLRSAEEAYVYLTRLRSILTYTGVCDGNMEEGSLRCDANVSVRRKGEPLGTRVELKNLNSFRNVERALKYEIARQIEVVGGGGTIVQQTLLYDADRGETRPMRSKEEAHDYRYFPEPDLMPLDVSESWIEEVRATLPELPAARKSRLVSAHALSDADAQILTLDKEMADYFESVVDAGAPAKEAAKWVLRDILAAMRDKTLNTADVLLPELDRRYPAARLASLIRLQNEGVINMASAREVFELSWTRSEPESLAGRGGSAAARERPAKPVIQASDGSAPSDPYATPPGGPAKSPPTRAANRSAAPDPDPAAIVAERGLGQISDQDAIVRAVEEAVAANPRQLEQYRGGKQALFGYFVGQVMKATGGRANPALVNDLLKQRLSRSD